MPTALPKLRQGDVVRVEVSDSNGNKKIRPAIVLTDPEGILPDSVCTVVAVSSKVPPDGVPLNQVELPWARPPRSSHSGLVKPSVAICNWIVNVKLSEVIEKMGFIPSKIMLSIIQQAGFPKEGKKKGGVQGSP